MVIRTGFLPHHCLKIFVRNQSAAWKKIFCGVSEKRKKRIPGSRDLIDVILKKKKLTFNQSLDYWLQVEQIVE